MDRALLDKIIKAYDIRGLVDDEITPDFAFSLGIAFAKFVEREREPATVVVGEDMRPSSPDLATAFSDGITSQGLDVIRIGLSSTDQLYFASGHLNLPGAMFTASHNPAEYNGIKLCKSGAKPIGQESGLLWIKEQIALGISEGFAIPNRPVGKESSRDLLTEYVEFLFGLFPPNTFAGTFKGRPIRIAIDAGNGMGGHTAPAVMSRINAVVDGIYFDLDGTFPNHEANPIEAKNLVDLQKLVQNKEADIGLAFDGDADRCFLVDEKGNLVSPSALTALIAERELVRNPGAPVIYNLICSRAVPEVISAAGGVPLRSRVGHSYIKKMMAENQAVFGGEHSGHFYFKDFWCADSGMLAALHAIAALLEEQEALSALLSRFNKYALSGEINTKVEDQKAAIQLIKTHFSSSKDSSKDSSKHSREEDVTFDELDGLTVSAQDWSFNVRPSNTEPLLRLNVEAITHEEMLRVQELVLRSIRNG
jgi:phosphomannomutase